MSGPESMRPDDQLLDEFLAGQGAVRETYRAMARERAPAHLDAAILHAGLAAVQPSPRARRPRWQMPVAAAAVMVLSFGVFLQVQRDPVVQEELMAVPARSANAAAPVATQRSRDAAKVEALEAAAPAREEADVETRRMPAVVAKPKPAPPAEKRRSAPAHTPPPPAPAPPAMAMADAPAPPVAAAAPAPEAAAMATESAERSAATGAMARESMQRQERLAAAPAPMSKAARPAAQASLSATPAESAQLSDEARSDAVSGELRQCPALVKGRAPMIATSADAIKAAKVVLSRRFTTEYLIQYEPLQAELRGERWRVHGVLPPDVVGGVPEVELCRSNGELLTVNHSR